ncbi:hypothetical protein BDY24DRAFT_412536 [Mrakia frigida]|uniref:FAD-binding oxidoreductase n=1 Tax=Mrakia frigida TaxID=29902 RepID=UPI003FCC0827
MSTSTQPDASSKTSTPWTEAINFLRTPGSPPSFTGDLVFPDSPDYSKSIDRWIASSIRPAGVVAGGGHSAAGASSTSGGLVVDLGRYVNSVVVDVANKTAVVGGGARFKAIEEAIAPFSLAVAAGAVNDTGVGGLSLGGGLGTLMGTTSLVVDNILAATVVLASGEIVRADAESNPDLYWAIRGGGGAFGAVTSFTFRLHDQRPTIGFGIALFETGQLPILMPKIHKWLEVRTPEEMGALACLYMEGKPLLLFLAVYNGPVEVGQQKFGEILETAFTGKDLREIPSSEVNTQLSGFQVRGATKYQTSSVLSKLSEETVAAALKQLDAVHAGERPGLIDIKIMFLLYNWDAASKVDPHGTPFFQRGINQIHLDTEIDYTPGQLSSARDVASAIRRLGGSQISYINFESEDGATQEKKKDERARATFGEENLARLREINAKYDPEKVFRSWFG